MNKLFYIPKNLNIKKKNQLQLTKHKHSSIRKLLAENLNIDKEAQLILAKDENLTVKRYLAFNMSICKETKLILADDVDDWISNLALDALNDSHISND